MVSEREKAKGDQGGRKLVLLVFLLIPFPDKTADLY